MNLSNLHIMLSFELLLKVQERLVKSVMSNYNATPAPHDLGCSVTLLSPKQISMISWTDLKEIQKNFTVQWTQSQMHALVKKKLGNLQVRKQGCWNLVSHRFPLFLYKHCVIPQCKQVSGEELKALQSVAGGLPSCMLKRIKAQWILNDPKALNIMSKQMNKGQLKALLHGVSKEREAGKTLWIKISCD